MALLVEQFDFLNVYGLPTDWPLDQPGYQLESSRKIIAAMCYITILNFDPKQVFSNCQTAWLEDRHLSYICFVHVQLVPRSYGMQMSGSKFLLE